MAISDFFLKIDGIEGESADHKHKNEIDVRSFRWSEKQSSTHHSARGAGGLGTGKVEMADITFSIITNKASPKLMLACATGQHIKEATLVCRKAGGDQQEYLKIKFGDLIVSSFEVASDESLGGGTKDAIGATRNYAREYGASAGVLTAEQFSFAFSKIWFEYSPQAITGGVVNPVMTGYDVIRNVKL
jgi:type VI secretion system secreted protein Hcp